MAKTNIGAGDVVIVLAGEPATLRPTLRAAQTISRASGGIVSAMQSVAKFEFDVVVNVIALGLGKVKPAEVNEVAEQVYATGMTDLVPKVTEFLTILANGGRPITAGGEENPPSQAG
jgi:hypothetical protein